MPSSRPVKARHVYKTKTVTTTRQNNGSLGNEGGGDHLGSPKHNRRQRRARADNHSDNATRDPTPSSSPEREEAPQPPTRRAASHARWRSRSRGRPHTRTSRQSEPPNRLGEASNPSESEGARTARPGWLEEGDSLDWDCLPDFVREVEAEQATIERKPSRRNNPSLGALWGSSVDHRHQSKAYRASAYELRHQKRALLASEAADPNPDLTGGYKPYEDLNESHHPRVATSVWRSPTGHPAPVGREGYEPSADELNQPQTTKGALPLVGSESQPGTKEPEPKRRPTLSGTGDSLPSFRSYADWDETTPRGNAGGGPSPRVDGRGH